MGLMIVLVTIVLVGVITLTVIDVLELRSKLQREHESEES